MIVNDIWFFWWFQRSAKIRLQSDILSNLADSRNSIESYYKSSLIA